MSDGSRPKTKTQRKTKAKRAGRPRAARKASSRRRSASGQARSRAGSQARNQARGASRAKRAAKRLGDLVADQVVPADAIALLEQDHREVEGLYAQFKDADSNAEKADLARKICLALTVHAEIEEAILYPRAKKVLDESDLVDEAEVEHASAKQLIAEIEEMTPRERLFDAKVKVLIEYVKHHVQEEENELFPQLRASDLDLVDLGKKLLKRKIALLEALT
jgi:hemerythrin superfamily protein